MRRSPGPPTVTAPRISAAATSSTPCTSPSRSWSSLNERLQATYREIEKNEVRFEAYNMEDAEIMRRCLRHRGAHLPSPPSTSLQRRGRQGRAHPAHHALALPVQGPARRRPSRRESRPFSSVELNAWARCWRTSSSAVHGQQPRRFLRPLRQPHADA